MISKEKLIKLPIITLEEISQEYYDKSKLIDLIIKARKEGLIK